VITSKQIITLIESYYDSVNSGGRNIQVFVNPTPDDYKELNAKKVRFIADAKNKKIYVWNAYFAIHNAIAYKIGLESRMDVDLFSGESDYYSNKLYMRDSSRLRNYVKNFRQGNERQIEHQYLLTFFGQDWSWIDKYVDGAVQYMKDNKQKFEKKNK
jgi:hypothetical protein